MGKKRVITKGDTEVTEKEKMDKAMKRGVKSRRRVESGRVHINCTYNNTTMTLSDDNGNVLAWASAGNLGFKGAKKSTPFAASKVAEVIVQKAQKVGVVRIIAFVKGVGSGRESALRTLSNKGLDLTSIKDITPIPHNGCRPKKPRRV
jgi:small subunit ribosomal protein S11